MRRAVGLCIHLAHATLLLIAALDDSRVRRSTRADVDRDAVDPRFTHDRAIEHIGSSITPTVQCPMPVWQPDHNVHFAALVIGVDPPAAGVTGATAYCVNPYVRSATYP
jgi:hypothetical protein